MNPSVFRVPVADSLSRNLSDGPAAMWAAMVSAATALSRAANALEQAARLAGSLPTTPLPLVAPGPGSGPALARADALGLSVVELVNDFLRAKAGAGRSDRYLRQLRVSLGSFVAGRSRQDVALVTCAEVERWLAGSGWSARTRRGYLGDVRALFNWAVRRGLLVRSPAAGIETPGPGLQSPPAIHSPAQVHQVLRLAMGGGSDLARLVAVGYFSGLRSAELLRLREVDFLRDRGFVEVTAANAKTRRRRLVRIGPALAAWLELPGAFPVPDATRRLRALRAAARRAGVPWPRNVLRHSWCSYHLARGANAAATALEAGHSETMLFAHYRELATPEVAAAFWAIRPD